MGTTTGGGVAGAMQPSNSILTPFSPQQMAQANAAAQYLMGTVAAPQGIVKGKRFTQLAQSVSFVPVFGQSQTISLQPQPVGLVTKYVIQVICTVTNPSAGTSMSRTGFGPFNLLSNISYTDPSQNQRINTYGFLLSTITAMRRRRVPGSAFTTDSPTGYGSVMAPIAGSSTIANNSTATTVSAFYEVPLSTGRNSLKGAIVANTIFSNQQLQVTFNPNFCQVSTDGLLAGYTGASASNPPTYSVTVNLYQEYWDQFTLGLLSPLGPLLSFIYEMKYSIFNSLVSNQYNYFRYSPLREYWSTVLCYDNGGVQNPGTDITNFQLQAANQTTFWQRSPLFQSYHTRNLFGDDAPAGVYFFDTHDDPIITAADGNTTLQMQPSSVQSNAYVIVGWEDIAVASVLASAPSIAGQGGS